MELLKLCADKHSDITKIKHLLSQPAVDPNIYDEVYLERLFASMIIIIIILLYHSLTKEGQWVFHLTLGTDGWGDGGVCVGWHYCVVLSTQSSAYNIIAKNFCGVNISWFCQILLKNRLLRIKFSWSSFQPALHLWWTRNITEEIFTVVLWLTKSTKFKPWILGHMIVSDNVCAQLCKLHLAVCMNQCHHILKLAREWEFPICNVCAMWVLFQISFRHHQEINENFSGWGRGVDKPHKWALSCETTNSYYPCTSISMFMLWIFVFQESASLLWWACYLGRTDVVILLLDKGVNVDLPSVSKLTLHA